VLWSEIQPTLSYAPADSEGGQSQEVSAVLGISITDYTIDFNYATTVMTPEVPLALPPTVAPPIETLSSSSDPELCKEFMINLRPLYEVGVVLLRHKSIEKFKEY